MELILAAEHSNFDLFKNPKDAADFLYIKGWPVAQHDSSTNVLTLNHKGQIYHLKADEALFALQLALIRCQIWRGVCTIPFPKTLAGPRRYFNINETPIATWLIGPEQDYPSASIYGFEKYLDPYSPVFFEIQRTIAADLSSKRELPWLQAAMQVSRENLNRAPIRKALAFANIMSQKRGTNPDLAVINAGLIYRTNAQGFRAFDSFLRGDAFKPSNSLNIVPQASYLSNRPPAQLPATKAIVETILPANDGYIAPEDLPEILFKPRPIEVAPPEPAKTLVLGSDVEAFFNKAITAPEADQVPLNDPADKAQPPTAEPTEHLQRSIEQSRPAAAEKPEVKPASKPKPLSSPNQVQPEVMVDEDELAQVKKAQRKAMTEPDPDEPQQEPPEQGFGYGR